MSILSTALPKYARKIRGKRRKAWSALAAQHGVSTRTLDRWAADGIIPPPEYINGRKYGDPDIAPRRDQAPPTPKVFPQNTEV
jgi:hypothetical protein